MRGTEASKLDMPNMEIPNSMQLTPTNDATDLGWVENCGKDAMSRWTKSNINSVDSKQVSRRIEVDKPRAMNSKISKANSSYTNDLSNDDEPTCTEFNASKDDITCPEPKTEKVDLGWVKNCGDNAISR